MAAFSNYMENELIDHIFRGRAFTAPATIYVGLFTAAPSDLGGGTEVTGGSYARASIATGFAAWTGTGGETTNVDSTGTAGTTQNNLAITFPSPTGAWGQVTHFAIFDASSGGNMIIYGALTTPKTVNNGDATPSFGIGSLQFRIDD